MPSVLAADAAPNETASRVPNGASLALMDDQTPEGLAVARALAAWMDGVAGGSPRTAVAYRREARTLLAFLGRLYGPGLCALLKARPSDVRAHVLGAPGLGDSSRALRAAVLRSLFGVLVVEGLMPTNPAAEVSVPVSALPWPPLAGCHMTLG